METLDYLQQSVAEVMDEKDVRAREFQEKARDCRKRIDTASFDLAEILFTIHQEALYTRLNYDNFQQYVENELDFELRKANYFVSMWNYYGVKLAANPEVREKMETVGWSKAKDLIGVVNPNNVDEWVEICKKNPATRVLELARGALQKMKEDPEGEVDVDDLDNKIEKFASKVFKLTDEQLHNVDLALKRAGDSAESDKPGHLLDLVCTNFLAMNAGVDGDEGLGYLLKSVEANFGIQVIALKNEQKQLKVVYGEQTVSRFAQAASQTDEDDDWASDETETDSVAY